MDTKRHLQTIKQNVVVQSVKLVCLLAGLPTALPIITKFGGNVAQRPWKKPLNFGCHPDHITLDLG